MAPKQCPSRHTRAPSVGPKFGTTACDSSSERYVRAIPLVRERNRMTARGEVVVFRPGEGTPHQVGGDRFFTKGSETTRSDAFSVVEYIGVPGVPGPPPHLHRSFEEAWFILEGSVTFSSAGRTTPANPGTYLFVPRSVPNTFQVTGDKPARWIGIFSPGRFVALVEELGLLIPAHGPPDPAAMATLFRRYDSELVREHS
jgi:mannose-6-phosphate isomerase-like protein (cupin superfamily)